MTWQGRTAMAAFLPKYKNLKRKTEDDRLENSRYGNNAGLKIMNILDRGTLREPGIKPVGKLVADGGLDMINDKAEALKEEQIVSLFFFEQCCARHYNCGSHEAVLK